MEKTLVYDDELKYLEEVERAAREFHRMYWLHKRLQELGVEDDDVLIQFAAAEDRLRRLLHVDLDALFETFDRIYCEIGVIDEDTWERLDIDRQWGDRLNNDDFKPAPEAAKELKEKLLEEEANGDG